VNPGREEPDVLIVEPDPAPHVSGQQPFIDVGVESAEGER
jgi:hypothetical protein